MANLTTVPIVDRINYEVTETAAMKLPILFQSHLYVRLTMLLCDRHCNVGIFLRELHHLSRVVSQRAEKTLLVGSNETETNHLVDVVMQMTRDPYLVDTNEKLQAQKTKLLEHIHLVRADMGSRFKVNIPNYFKWIDTIFNEVYSSSTRSSSLLMSFVVVYIIPMALKRCVRRDHFYRHHEKNSYHMRSSPYLRRCVQKN